MLPVGRTVAGLGDVAVLAEAEAEAEVVYTRGPDPDRRCLGLGLESAESSPEWQLRLPPASDLRGGGGWCLPREPEEEELELAAGRVWSGEMGDPRSGSFLESGLLSPSSDIEWNRSKRELSPERDISKRLIGFGSDLCQMRGVQLAVVVGE